jgi:hypothetical protein
MFIFFSESTRSGLWLWGGCIRDRAARRTRVHRESTEPDPGPVLRRLVSNPGEK